MSLHFIYYLVKLMTIIQWQSVQTIATILPAVKPLMDITNLHQWEPISVIYKDMVLLVVL